MRVLVTGGTGFVGAHVVRACLAHGWQVRCALRGSSSLRAIEGLPVERAVLDLCDPGAVRSALEGCEGVLHVAGLFDPGPGGIARMRRVHVEGTRTLLDAALALHPAPRFVLCSSSITLGWGSRERPADEDSPAPDPDRVYGRGTALRAYHDDKVEAERLVREAAARGLHALAVNPDYVLGAWDSKPTSGAIVLALARRPLPFYPRGGKCFVDAADCGLGHVLALERGRPGARYLLGVHNLPYRDFLAEVARQVGRRPPWLPLPRAATQAAGLFGALLTRLDGERFAGLDPRVLATMQEERYRDGRRAREELGLPQTPIAHSIAEALRWFREHGYC